MTGPGRPSAFTGATILGVAIDIGVQQYVDPEKEATAAFARD